MKMENRWIDVHTHLDKIKTSVDETLRLGKDHGVERFITIGTEPADHPVVLELAQKNQPYVYCTLGVHPHDAESWSPEVESFIREKSQEPVVVALGEMGLDFYYDNAPRDLQKDVFTEQLELAKEVDLPVEIHTRDADQETMEFLEKYQRQGAGLIHCFSGSKELAYKALDCGYNISISGIVTFKGAKELREIVKTLPLDRIHVETDSPFLAPVPKRGKENTSAFVVHTAKCVAELLNVSEDVLSKQTKENALKLFKKLKW